MIVEPLYTLWIPVFVGGAIGFLIAVGTRAKDALPIGLVIYTFTRTTLNALRSVEAVIMAIVFVIAVGIGPFAGVLALGLHTIVSLAKLYSEQVESISPGPLEAVQATGGSHARCVVLIEASEESGSPDLPAHLAALGDRLAGTDLVLCLDSGCLDYDRLWVTTSLRGLVGGTLTVEVLCGL